jgi:hypothetical protein
MNSSNDGDLFDGAVEIDCRKERGQSFGLGVQTYHRMARCCLNASQCGIEPCAIAHLPGDPNGKGGCIVTLFGMKNCYKLCVQVAPVLRISLAALPLDSVEPLGPELVCGSDCAPDWDNILRTLFAAEGCNLVTEESLRSQERLR